MQRLGVSIILFATQVLSASIPAAHGGSSWKRQHSHGGSTTNTKLETVGSMGFYGKLASSAPSAAETDCVTIAGGYGRVADPAGAAPRRQTLQTTSTLPGVKRIKIREGPYNIPSMNKKSQSGHLGMLENFVDKSIAKPCNGECTIIWQQAGLEYADGVVANIDTGLW
jgi:hypothetical protein